MREALDAQLRYQRALTQPVSPRVRDRVAGIGERVERAVALCWRVAVQGANLERVLATLESVPDLRLRVATLERIGPAGAAGTGVAASLRAQLESVERLLEACAQAHERLEALGAELDSVVARAVELSFGTDEHDELGQLERRMDGLVSDMEALARVVDHARDP